MIWGSFLNVVAYRVIQGKDIVFPRSFCPKCKSTIAWYDLLPVVSWIFLKASCRNCSASISYLYPLIELLTALIFVSAYYFIHPAYWLAYFILLSALIVTIRTDLETMLISRFSTLYLIPIAFLLSYFELLPIDLLLSALGALLGYFSLWTIAKIFYLVRKKKGLGEGDFELLAMIGAFLGPIGVWFTTIIASMLGTLIGLLLIMAYKYKQDAKIAFGPFLAIGAIIYVFSQNYLQLFL